jgi:MYXO-CTERM domain-containing protein
LTALVEYHRLMLDRASARRPVVAAAALACWLAAGSARAFVRTKTEAGMPGAWHTPSVRLAETDGRLQDLPLDDVRGLVRQALASWSYPAVPCTSLELSLTTASTAPAVVAYDGVNSLIFREVTWCDRPTCTDPSSLALTSVFIRSATGEILDADIEINAVAHRWTSIPDSGINPVPGARDLRNVLTHEIGHLVGLDHNCVSPGQLPAQDHLGNPAPDCASAPASVRAATMFVPDRLLVDDISLRTLAADDVLAVCSVYPRAAAPDAGDAGGDGAGGGPADASADSPAQPAPDASPTTAPDGAAEAAGDPAQAGGSDGGCGCRVGGASGGRPALGARLVLLTAALLLLRRRPPPPAETKR